MSASKSDLYVFTNSADGYQEVHSIDEKGHDFCYLHQLTAIADGANPYEVFGGEKHIHHKNNLSFDNRPENLTAVTPQEHGVLHQESSEGVTVE